MIKTFLFVCLLHFGVSAQSEIIGLSSSGDSLSFALGIETGQDLSELNSHYDALNKMALVKGFQSNLSEASCTDCDETLINFFGELKPDFDQRALKNISICFGRLAASSFYLEMKEIGQLQRLDLALVIRGFKQYVYNEYSTNLSEEERLSILARFANELEDLK